MWVDLRVSSFNARRAGAGRALHYAKVLFARAKSAIVCLQEVKTCDLPFDMLTARRITSPAGPALAYLWASPCKYCRNPQDGDPLAVAILLNPRFASNFVVEPLHSPDPRLSGRLGALRLRVHGFQFLLVNIYAPSTQSAAELGAFFFAVTWFVYTHFQNGEELVVVGDCNATLWPRRDRRVPSGRIPETQIDKAEVLNGFINGLGVFDTAYRKLFSYRTPRFSARMDYVFASPGMPVDGNYVTTISRGRTDHRPISTQFRIALRSVFPSVPHWAERLLPGTCRDPPPCGHVATVGEWSEVKRRWKDRKYCAYVALKSMLLRSLKMYGQLPPPFSAFPTVSTSSLDTPFGDAHRQLLAAYSAFLRRSAAAPQANFDANRLSAFLNNTPRPAAELPLGRVSTDEVEDAILALRSSGTGPDGIGVELYKLHIDALAPILARVFTALVFAAPQDPSVASFSSSRLALVPKKSNAFRPICVASVDYRIFAKVLLKRVVAHCHPAMSRRQFAFYPRVGDQLFLPSWLREALPSTSALALIDFTSAFDSCQHGAIAAVLHHLRLTPYVDLVLGMLRSPVIATPRDLLLPSCGVRQGCPLSPVVFNLLHEPFLHSTPTAALFADDLSALLQPPAQLAPLLDQLANWSLATGLDVNWAKSHVVALDDGAVLPLQRILRVRNVPRTLRRRVGALSFEVLGVRFASRPPFAAHRALSAAGQGPPPVEAQVWRDDNAYALRMCAFDVAALLAVPPPVPGEDLRAIGFGARLSAGVVLKTLRVDDALPHPTLFRAFAARVFVELRAYPSAAAVDVDRVIDGALRAVPSPPLAALNYVAVALHGALEFLHDAALDAAPDEFAGFDLGPLPPGPGPPALAPLVP